MKKLPFYIAVGVAVAAVSTLIIIEIKRKNQTITPATIPQGADYLLNDQSAASTLLKNYNYSLLLNANTHNGTEEIKALQSLINAYYGSNVVTVSGTYDSTTEAVIRDITGKSTTSLFEFTYMYLSPERGENVALQILQNLRSQS